MLPMPVAAGYGKQERGVRRLTKEKYELNNANKYIFQNVYLYNVPGWWHLKTLLKCSLCK